MKIIIEIKGGVFVGAYQIEGIKEEMEILVADLDGLSIGENLQIENIQIEPLKNASKEVREYLE